VKMTMIDGETSIVAMSRALRGRHINCENSILMS